MIIRAVSRHTFGLWLVLLSLTLHGCGTTKDADQSEAARDPSDAAFRSVMDDYLLMSGAPRNSQYDYARLDLNGDGRRDALVLFTLPHRYWCGWGGCTLAVFEATDDRFSLISRIKHIRGPILVSPMKSHGWNDIIIRLTGMDRYDETVRLPFNGQTYPADPSVVSPIPYDFGNIVGARLFP